MTRYAIDPARNVLVALWSTGIGDTTTLVADLPEMEDIGNVRHLAAQLTRLSEICWRSYTHPASAADQHGPHSIGWRRQQERDAFAGVLPTLIAAHRTSVRPAATQVGRAAHAVAMALHTLGVPGLATHITTDVAAELAAIEQAELGDLSDRAEQAVALSREDASPLHISQADALLRAQPFGCPELLTQIDPAAASVAAAHWYHAAVTVAARHTGLHQVHVVASAEQHSKPLALESLTEITAVITSGGRPRHVVMPLIRNALHVADGHLRGITDIHERVIAAQDLLSKADADHPDLGLEPNTIFVPLTPLDPARPAPDLLDNLLHGIHTCWQVYQDGQTEEGRDELLQQFLGELRQEALDHTDRLL
ncbi:hypothetical protein GCM10009850_093350 [Nonomuraea monospora]|uniref:Uncharacterized protein n=1 Tax=Nonomuraea monospora TaxID=568818 RepID=A0ABN3CWJ6_9ACTN